MQPSEMRTLYEYTNWATERLLSTAAQATSEQLLAPGTAGRGSTRDTLTHMVNGQRSWLATWDASRTADAGLLTPLNPEDYPNAAALQAAWVTVNQATFAYIDTIGAADLERQVERASGNRQPYSLPLWQMMVHVVNHGTQHRSEAAAMLTAFGHSPGEFDVVRYLAPSTR